MRLASILRMISTNSIAPRRALINNLARSVSSESCRRRYLLKVVEPNQPTSVELNHRSEADDDTHRPRRIRLRPTKRPADSALASAAHARMCGVFLGLDLGGKTNAMRIQLSSGRSDRLMRVTTASQERFSCCGYLRSKQCITPRTPPEKLHRL
jgi:hypothetical protein